VDTSVLRNLPSLLYIAISKGAIAPITMGGCMRGRAPQQIETEEETALVELNRDLMKRPVGAPSSDSVCQYPISSATLPCSGYCVLGAIFA